MNLYLYPKNPSHLCSFVFIGWCLSIFLTCMLWISYLLKVKPVGQKHEDRVAWHNRSDSAEVWASYLLQLSFSLPNNFQLSWDTTIPMENDFIIIKQKDVFPVKDEFKKKKKSLDLRVHLEPL